MKEFRIFLTVFFLLTLVTMALSDDCPSWSGPTNNSGNFVAGSPAPSKSLSFSTNIQAWSWTGSESIWLWNCIGMGRSRLW